MADLLPRRAEPRRAALFACLSLLAATPLRAQVPVSLTLATPTTLCAQDVTGQVTLGAPAPDAGLTVLLSSSMPTVVAVPASITIPAGATSASLRIPRCTPTPQAIAVTISATVNGTTQSAILNVLAPTLKAITLKTNATSPVSFTGAAALQGPAPAGGVIVTLANSHPSLLNAPTSVTIAAGATSANFTMAATAAVSQATTVTITGTGLGATVSANAIVPTAAPVSVLFLANGTATATLTMPSGSGATAKLTLNGPAGPNGLAITLSSSNNAIASVPAVFTMPAFDSVAQFTVTTTTPSQTATVTIAATVGAATASGTLTLTGTTLRSFSVSPDKVVAGLVTEGRLMASRAAGPGGLSVRFTSSNGDLVQLPAIVTIPEGATEATFPVVTRYADAPRTIALSATGGGVTQSTSVTLTPEGISAFSISPTAMIGGTTVLGRLSAPFGHNGFTVTLASSNPEVATVPAVVVFTAQDTTKNFTITSIPTRVAATARITATVTSKRTTTISAIAIGTVKQSHSADVSVSPPTIRSVTISPDRVVGGSSAVFTGTVTLTGPAPSGMGVSLTSTDPAVGVPTGIMFTAGSTTATFTARTLAVTADKDVTIRASMDNSFRYATATVRVTMRP